MNLRDLEFFQKKSVYDSAKDNVLEDFYIPALSCAVKYNRLAGYFSSNCLAIAAKGISQFIKNGGTIRLIANVKLSLEDQNAIKEVINGIEEDIIVEMDELEDELKRNHLKMLGWLIKHKKLEIKIAVTSKGIEHQKYGILEDPFGNIVEFFGSDNETTYGWIYNHERFHTFRNWIENEFEDHLKPDIKAFEELWNDSTPNVEVYDVSEAFNKKLIERAPENDKQFESLSKENTERLIEENRKIYSAVKKNEKITEEQVHLFPYQEEAIKKWEENNFRGVFEMATGTGKTFTALGCLTKLKEKKLITIIVCPYNHLLFQWLKEVIKFSLDGEKIIADSSNNGWEDQVADELTEIELGRKNKLIILTTYNTFSNDLFINLFKNREEKIILIADEMHWSGAETFSNGLINNYAYRIGLSATPSRYFDDEGTNLIIEYFGGVIFEFDLKKAINTINPLTGKTFLTPYKYYPHFVELGHEALDKYEQISKQIARQYAISKSKKEKEELVQLLIYKRQKIIVDCDNKYSAFDTILDTIGDDVKYCLVYCSEKQIKSIQQTLSQKGIINRKFTGDEGTKSSKKFGGLSERDYILERFGRKNPEYQVLVAMKCLDEGIDVPPARIAVIMASSGNPKQYIQRRGRVLRRAEGKELAEIFDIIVLPTLKGDIAPGTEEIEKKILTNELKRYDEFAKIAKNYPEALNSIFRIKRRYGLI